MELKSGDVLRTGPGRAAYLMLPRAAGETGEARDSLSIRAACGRRDRFAARWMSVAELVRLHHGHIGEARPHDVAIPRRHRQRSALHTRHRDLWAGPTRAGYGWPCSKAAIDKHPRAGQRLPEHGGSRCPTYDARAARRPRSRPPIRGFQHCWRGRAKSRGAMRGARQRASGACWAPVAGSAKSRGSKSMTDRGVPACARAFVRVGQKSGRLALRGAADGFFQAPLKPRCALPPEGRHRPTIPASRVRPSCCCRAADSDQPPAAAP